MAVVEAVEFGCVCRLRRVGCDFSAVYSASLACVPAWFLCSLLCFMLYNAVE